MIPRAFDKITPADLHALIDNGIREGRTIDYKQACYGGSDGDKKELLADMTSFANAAGGDILIGMAEAEGLPTEITGIGSKDADAEILRLGSILRASVEPRILGDQMQAIDCGDGKTVIHIRIPQSWNAPHRITFKGTNRFYTRNSAGKHEMDITELRHAFSLADGLETKIRNFRDNRLARIISGETPVPLQDAPKYVLHILPIESFTSGTRYSIDDIKSLSWRPLYVTGWSDRINLDGLLVHSSQDGVASSYCQVYRAGYVEAVLAYRPRTGDSPTIPSIWFEKELIKGLRSYIDELRKLGVQCPLVVLLTLMGMKGYEMHPGRGYFHTDDSPIDRDPLLLPDCLMESYDEEPAAVLRPAFDAVWNACGYEKSLNYDDDGNWRAHR